MDFSIKFKTIKLSWSIVYIEGAHVIIFRNVSYIGIVLAITADSGEMQQSSDSVLFLKVPHHPSLISIRVA